MVMLSRWTGREASALRQAQRMSVRAYAEHLGMSVASVAAWDRRGELARLRTETQQLLDTDLARASVGVHERFEAILTAAAPAASGSDGSALGAEDDLLDRGSHAAEPTDLRIELLTRPTMGRAPAAAYVPFLPAALQQPAQDWLHGRTPPMPPAVIGRVVEAEAVSAAACQLAVLRELDHEHGAGVAGQRVTSFINGLAGDLAGRRYDDAELRVAGYRVVVGARELAGYQAVDSGADGVAQRHYLHALRLAAEVGDRSLGAYLLGVSLGHLALHCGYPRQGLRLAQTALAGAGGETTLAVRASLWAVVARAYARLGDELACTMALRSAEMHLAGSDRLTEPEWISYLTPAYLADEIAHCMFDLCRHDAAQRQVTEAVNGIGAGRVRRLVIDTALLASSLAAVGKVEEACVRGREAVDLATRTVSARAVQRIAQVRGDLIPHEGARPVTELVDYIHDVLPAAAL